MDLRTMITRYCQYQDRCQKEVRNKLYENGASKNEVAELLIELIGIKLIDEERYARSFARGKFRIKNWGRCKIVYELKQDQISDYCIQKGLTEIDEEEYLQTLERLTERKMADIKKEQNVFARRAKLQRYLTQKGYENELVADMLKRLM
ncbi:MAG: regulatory protein RecX [Phycisphaerales bacterium]|nr:regulatory protein RecX [Phycisphaerales bacterium]